MLKLLQALDFVELTRQSSSKQTQEMLDNGYTFFLAENGVWLVDQVIDRIFLDVHEYCSK